MAFFRAFSWLIGSVILGSCSLEPYQSGQVATIHINKPPMNDSALEYYHSVLDETYLSKYISFAFTSPPSASSDFECLALNAVGEGIPSAQADIAADPKKVWDGSSCAYPGVTSVPISLTDGVSKTLVVPLGEKRIFQLIGIDDDNHTICNRSSPVGEMDEIDGNNNIRLYEWDRALVEDLKADLSLTLKNNFDANNLKKVDCNDSDGGSGNCTSGSAQITQGTDSGFLNQDTTYILAQSFNPATTFKVSEIDVYFANNAGTPAGTATLEIRTDNGSTEPDMTSGGLKDTVSTSSLSTSPSYHSFTYDGEVVLNSGTSYWFVLKKDTGKFNTRWDSSNPYGGGRVRLSTNSGTSWSTAYAGYDMRFIIKGCTS